MSRPYEVQIWNGAHVTLGSFAEFSSALAAYRKVKNATKQLVNVDRADSGRDGLTDDERDQLMSEVA